ncbi:MAG: Tetratricopeptide 2 repeat protein [Bryobacterales bacterium]|nr:Tetratricopeptide 2 repeat protein [Bryobacterales bacterium]
MAERLVTLFQIYYRPSRALSTILDSGSLALAVIAAAVIALAFGEISRVVLIVVLFVPACIAIISLWDHLGSLGVVLRRDYSPLLVCALMCWIAASIPGVLAGLIAPAFTFWIHTAVDLYFLALAAIAVRTVFGTSAGRAAGTILGGLAATVGGYFAYETFGGALSYFASPFMLFWLYYLFRPNLDMFTGLGGGLRSRQNFNRHLEALTVNPRDADAHYQLGLIYQQRRNYAEAIARFTKAVEIDPSETDAHYQLGCIALEQKRYDDARRHFAAAVALDDKHSSSEVWRGLGAADLQLGKTEQALAELERYTVRREFDPEGLYWLGAAYKNLGRVPESRDAFQRAVEAARTSPPHRRRFTASWGRQAKAELRSLS